jgi:hypothetical protein
VFRIVVFFSAVSFAGILRCPAAVGNLASNHHFVHHADNVRPAGSAGLKAASSKGLGGRPLLPHSAA